MARSRDEEGRLDKCRISVRVARAAGRREMAWVVKWAIACCCEKCRVASGSEVDDIVLVLDA